MVRLEKTLKISAKGQLTLPKQAREMLGTDLVHIVVEEDHISIEPASDLAGSLKAYARPVASSIEERDAGWEAAVREKHSRH